MRIYERLPGRVHAMQPSRKRYDDIIATLSRRPVVDSIAEPAQDDLDERSTRSAEPDRRDA